MLVRSPFSAFSAKVFYHNNAILTQDFEEIMKIVIFLLNPEKQGFPPGPLLRAVTFISWLLPVYMKCCKYLFMDISGVSSFHPVPLKTVKPQKSGIRFWYVYRIMVSKAPFVLRSYHILLLQINLHINIWYRAGARTLLTP